MEFLGIIYSIAKDIKGYFAYKESEKKIDDNYVEQIKKRHKDNGEEIKFFWGNEEKIDARKADGWECYYEIDKSKKIRFILKNKSNQILMSKK